LYRGRGNGRRRALTALFWCTAILLALSFVFTICGSAANHDGLLFAGIIGWLTTSFLVFTWLVLWMWSRTGRYRR